ncbi:MAG: hypothetical protein HY956_09450 [Deltaproteobacteria bacterium]|nr:hypothetical protein [Deltaproteobacteria bacterium]
MRIIDSNILFAEARSFVEREAKSERLTAWVGGERPRGADAVPDERPKDRVVLSEEARARLATIKGQGKRYLGAREIEIDGGVDHDTFLKKLLIEALTGRRIKVMTIEKEPSAEMKRTEEALKDAGDGREGWGLEYDSRAVTAEIEETSFSASGVIKTADGQELSFSLELTMQRASITEETVGLRAGDARRVDPLVINFGGRAAELTSMKFAFDLDSDGDEEDISFAAPGSGFLAIDRNGDGKVNNGGELFGPATGNGFKELSAYDTDKNSWIDENDVAFGSLFVWTRDASGADTLKSLKEQGVGAIYLGYASTSFDLKSVDNADLGQVRRSGVYLSEAGDVGTVQQVDLVV